jgi:hypothetical protein
MQLRGREVFDGKRKRGQKTIDGFAAATSNNIVYKYTEPPLEGFVSRHYYPLNIQTDLYAHIESQMAEKDEDVSLMCREWSYTPTGLFESFKEYLTEYRNEMNEHISMLDEDTTLPAVKFHYNGKRQIVAVDIGYTCVVEFTYFDDGSVSLQTVLPKFNQFDDAQLNALLEKLGIHPQRTVFNEDGSVLRTELL